MKSRKKKSKPVRAKRYARKQKQQQLEYNNLEPRQLLAADLLTDVVYRASSDGSDLISLETPVPIAEADDLLRTQLNLGENESVELVYQSTNNSGWTQYKYQQHINGVPVEGSSYKLHAIDGEVSIMSGDRIQVQNVVLGTEITEAEGLQAAIDFIGADLYEWELPGQLGEPIETPTPEHVYLTNVNGESVVAFKYLIRAVEPTFSSDHVYVNANTGDVEYASTTIRNQDTPAAALLSTGTLVPITAFSTTGVSFTLENEGGSLNLPGAVQGALEGIETRDASNNLNIYTENNPLFLDTEGGNAHYGAEQSLEYFWENHGRLSFDNGQLSGLGAKVINNANLPIANAFWDGQSLSYGGGFGVVDVAGHEFSHAVTTYSANLVYQNEFGALNESFSDIFGETIEEHAREAQGLGADANDWLLGAEIPGIGAIRSMSNPNDFGDPRYYQGNFWEFGSFDRGGVHINSGVQNQWFFLVAEGTSSFPDGVFVNEVGERFQFDGIGIDKAGTIAYRNLNEFLSEFSEYEDARDGAVMAAMLEFGRNSPEWEVARKAWQAVGLYENRIIVDEVDEVFPGSIIYSSTGNSQPTDLDPVEVWVNLNEGQTLSLVVTPLEFQDLNTSVEIGTHDFAPAGPFAPDSNEIIVVNEFPITESGQTVITIDGSVDQDFFGNIIRRQLGKFEYKLVLNSELEIESVGDELNETIADAQDITEGIYTVGTGERSADRFAVVGTFEDDEIAVQDVDEFETGALGGQWQTFSSDGDLGRIEVSNRYGTGIGGGEFALFMDTTGVDHNLNEAIWTVDLSGALEPVLSFGYVEFNDENTDLPDVFSNSRIGDGVSVSDDGQIWHTILTDTETPSGEWNYFEINLGEFAINNGLDRSGEFFVKFQQYDDGRITSGGTTDGRGFDNVKIVTGEPSEDWYSFNASVSDVVTLAVGNRDNDDSLMVELYDSSGLLLASGVDQPNQINAVSSYYINSSDTYFARVQGQGLLDYGFTAFVDSDLDTGSTVDDVQAISITNSVAGAISAIQGAGADPDVVEDMLPVDDAFEGVTLSNDVTGGSVYAPLATFIAPTGTKVFGTDPMVDNGWQEDVNEFRADFEIGQFQVRLDFGSDDGSNDRGFLRAYNALGELLDEEFTDPIEPGKSETLTVFNGLGDISYIVAGGVGTDVTPIDNLVYTVADDTTDYYVFDATAGRSLDILASFPNFPGDNSGFGGVASQFQNQLKLQRFAGEIVNLRMELTEVATGTVVATGDEAITFDVVNSGDYQLKVSSVAGQGNYFIDVQHTLGDLVNVGLTGEGVAISDTATGTGYIMFSEDRVHDRFSVNPPNETNSDHMIAVRFNEGTGQWQYNNDQGWFTFEPQESDRILAAVNFNSDHVQSYEGATGSIQGVTKGYLRSDLSFTPNQYGGIADDHEVAVDGTFFDTEASNFVPEGTMNAGVAISDEATGVGFLMFSRESVHERFDTAGETPNANNSDHFIGVRQNGSDWEYNNALGWFRFTPAAGDRLVAQLDLDAKTATPMLGATGSINGISQGYSDGDLAFTANQFGGVFNYGEFTVEGTFYEGFDDDAMIDPATLGNGVAITDGATGSGFLMYSPENVHTRFASAAPNPAAADHFIGVRYNRWTGWEYNNAFDWVSFAPSDGDRLVAELDLGSRTVTSLEGKSGEIQGVQQGYETGDLVFTADRWAGGFNAGEYEVTGSFFESRTSSGGIGNLGSGVAVTDYTTGQGYFMYSQESVHERFTTPPNADQADHLIAVMYNEATSKWWYNNRLDWIEFTPRTSDVLFAEVDYATQEIQFLEGVSGHVNGITAGYFDSDLSVQINRWNGRHNFGEYTFSGSYLIGNTATDRQIGPVGSGIAVHETATGSGFVMYSAENLFERFSMSPPLAGSSQHLLAVRFDDTTSTWQYSDDTQWIDFAIADEDRLLATLDFDNDMFVSLEGTNTLYMGALAGFASSDLTFAANSGDFTATGTYFNA